VKIYVTGKGAKQENVLVEGLTPEQQTLYDDRKGMLRYKAQKSAKPKPAYVVECFTCGGQGIVWSGGRGTLEIVVNLSLLLKGWIWGQRGYECPDCYNASIDAMVQATDRFSGAPSNEVEGTVAAEPQIDPPLFEDEVDRLIERVNSIDPFSEHINARYTPATWTLRLREIGASKPISGEFDLSSMVGVRGATDWLKTMARRLERSI
jgi:hypothetical protein